MSAQIVLFPKAFNAPIPGDDPFVARLVADIERAIMAPRDECERVAFQHFREGQREQT